MEPSAPTEQLKSAIGGVLARFGASVVEGRPELKWHLDQPPSVHYESSNLLSFTTESIVEDLVVVSATLDLRSGTPVWMIDATTGPGAAIAELHVEPILAATMASDPAQTASTLDRFLADQRLAISAALAAAGA